jgi:hypothetical protein
LLDLTNQSRTVLADEILQRPGNDQANFVFARTIEELEDQLPGLGSWPAADELRNGFPTPEVLLIG